MTNCAGRLNILSMDGLEIKIARIRAGLKQKEVAERVGVSQAYICEIEHGREIPTPVRLEQILKAIGDGRTPNTD